MSKYSVSLSGSGDLIKDGFSTEGDAYKWISELLQFNTGSLPEVLDGYVVEREDEDELRSGQS